MSDEGSPPVPPEDLPWPRPILARIRGGEVVSSGVTYCRIYQSRPVCPEERVMCSGMGVWSPCADLERCRANAPGCGAPPYKLPGA